MDTLGSILDKLTTTGSKMFDAQSSLYRIRKLTFEEFKDEFQKSDEGMLEIYTMFKKSMELNIQRQALIQEFDEKLLSIITSAVRGENLDDGTIVIPQLKTY